jgi:NAD(P)-dependent dehydrogenase (short-subunit alcohol dehydrogenase family)
MNAVVSRVHPLAGKVAFVTGAGRGLGRAIALDLAAAGADVAVVSRTAQQVQQTAAELRDLGVRAVGFAADLVAPGAAAAAVARVAAELGPVDILVNNAADTAVSSMCCPVETVGVAQIDQQMLTSPYLALQLMQACLPHMKEAGGRIINMGSAAGVDGVANFLPYAIAKEGMRALTRVAAREWGRHGITVNAVCPAADTGAAHDAISSGNLDDVLKSASPAIARLGDCAKDVAPLITFLAGPQASYLSGYTYMVDGGACIDAAR